MKPKKILYFVSLPFIFLLQACPFVCNTETKTLPPLSDSVLASVPYSRNEKVLFKHSSGHVITFNCSREKKLETWSCEECCDKTEYETDLTEMQPDYPISAITLYIVGGEDDEANLQIRFASESFELPLSHKAVIPADSLQFGGRMFYKVYQLAAYNYNYGYGVNHELYTDSLYYNFENGIIKITMTNGEYFELYEE